LTAFVTGLTAEARLLSRFPAYVGGGTTEGARRQAEVAIAQGAQALISFGLAGGLDPALPPGSLLRPERVSWRGALLSADKTLLAALGGATCGVLLAGESIAVTAGEKRALRDQSGAAAIDLESGAVADVAARHGIPFAVLRAVCDPAERDLPPAALAALDEKGAIGFLRVGISVLRQPRQIPSLLALAGDAARARRALAQEIEVLLTRGALTPWQTQVFAPRN
jgi:adenosylhomocysteine nucleosidase